MADRPIHPPARDMLPGVVAAQAAKIPDAPFVRETGGREASYLEVHELSLRWAAALERAGIGPGDPVATMLPTGVEAIALWLGLGWCRGLEVAMNPQYRADMLQYALEYTQPRLMVIPGDLLGTLADCPAARSLDLLVVSTPPVGPPDLGSDLGIPTVDVETFLAGVTVSADPAPPQPWDTACIIFTSGTTGPSKGVILPWGMIDAAAQTSYPLSRIRADDLYYCALPFYHFLGRNCVSQMALTGRPLVARPTFSATEFWSDVRRFGATLAFTFAAPLQQAPPSPDDADNPLREVFMAPLIPEYEEFSRRFDVHVETMFGMTELGMGFVSGPTITHPGSCGRPVEGEHGLQVRLVDEHDFDVPVGETGELIARTSVPWTLNGGYFRMPEATARAWRNGWFHTGDGFRRDADGNYFFVERINDYIRRRGENISAFEVEQAINQHPGVLESAAIAVPAATGEDDVKVCVVTRAGAAVTVEGLAAEAELRLPSYMRPRYYELLTELPRTATLKVRKVELRRDPLNDRTWDRLAAGPNR